MLNKKIIALLLLVCLVVAGCGAKDKNQTTSEPEDKTETVSGDAEAAEPESEETAKEETVTEEESAASTEETGNDHLFTLYSLGGDEVAEITVPEFLTETNYTKVTITANDEMTYEAAYAAYTDWNADAFFNEVLKVDAFINNDQFSNVEESAVETVTVNGNEVKWKKITTVYEGEMDYTQYAAAIEIEGGVIGITLYATNVPSENTELFEVLSGITLK